MDQRHYHITEWKYGSKSYKEQSMLYMFLHSNTARRRQATDKLRMLKFQQYESINSDICFTMMESLILPIVTVNLILSK